jgi:hypothetical protein
VKTPAERQQEVQKLLGDAKDVSGSKDDQYVMLSRVAEEAAAIGELPLAFEAVELLARGFEVDRVALRLGAVTRASKLPAPPAVKVKVFGDSVAVLEEAMQADRYAEVEDLVGPMLTVVQRAGDRDLSVKLLDLRKRAAALDAEFRRYKTAQMALTTNPDDPTANQTAGQFHAYVKRDWEAALPHLAKGSDVALRDAAEQDVAGPQTAAQQVLLAESWAALATGRDDRARASLLSRAQYWYSIARPQLTGLDEKSVAGKIAEIEGTIASLGQPASGGPRRAIIVAAADYEFQLYLNGEYVTSGRGSRAYSAQRTLKPGDVITVKANNVGGAYGFAATVQFEGSSRYLATGDANSGWRLYQPASRDTWFDAQGISDESDPLPSPGGRHLDIVRQTGLRCASIWSSDSREAYLVLRVR